VDAQADIQADALAGHKGRRAGMSTSIEDWLECLQALSEELKTSPAGRAHYQELQQLLQRWRSRRDQLDRDFSIQLSFFLGTLADKTLQTDVAAIVERLTRPEPARASRETTPSTSARKSAPTGKKNRPLDEAFVDLDYPDRQQEPPPAERSTDKESTQATAGATYPQVERRVNSAYRQHLDRKHGEIEKLQELLAQKAMEAMAQNKEFGALLETERAALLNAGNVNDIDNMKQIMIGGTDELLAGQRNLAEKLQSSFEYLELIKNDSERLHNELNKVKLLSLTDENTGLPNRRAFLRRLDDEMERAGRFQMPISLALIDLDFFKEINDTHGHPAGDAVLAWYAQHALPIFRNYDLVARWGGEEFAILFPGTSLHGAQQALVKLRRHIQGASVAYDGKDIDVPTFSAGLTGYRAGDTEEDLIKRADQALYLAKNKGRDRIEVESGLPTDDAVNLEQ